ncbi:MAG: hypothetical protein J6Q94_07710 [Clostridia bacterium]|nr:hypothetical protein [Clostridia bacterium]
MKKMCISVSLIVCFLMLSVTGCFSEQQKPVADLESVSIRDAVADEDDVALLQQIFESETAYLASLQLENGAIPMTRSENGELSMNPYFADFAALALLDDADEYADEVKKYTDWHFDHLNTKEIDCNGIDGTIYDYIITVADGKVTGETVKETDGKKTYDSTDSYAATFLMVLEKYYEKTNDADYILSHCKDIERIVNAMLSTLHKGLTFAKPDYEVKYLMDNSEVYEGAIAAFALFRDVICPSDSSYDKTAEKCEKTAEKIVAAIEKYLWNASENHYESAIFRDRKAAYEFSWDEYYPDATAQLFPIIHGVIAADSKRADTLYDSFCNSFDWQNFDIPSEFCWGSNVLAAAYMNDLESVICYMQNFAEIYEKHEYPLYNADSARVCMAAYIMLEKAR